MLGVNKAYCLCLDKRKEHWLDLEKQCESKGIEFNRFIVGDGKILPPEEYSQLNTRLPTEFRWGYGGGKNDTFKETYKKITHHYNAFLSHQAMAKLALDSGEEKVLFLEDDAYFTNRFDEVVSQIESSDDELSYDMLYLGWWIGQEGDRFNEHIEREWKELSIYQIEKADVIGGLHGVILSRKILDLITKLAPVNPIDSQMNGGTKHKHLCHYKIKSYFVAPKIIHDKGLFSECSQNTIERTKL